MLVNFSKTILPTITSTNTLCFAAALLAGRKFGLSAGYKIGGIVADLMGKQNVAEWNKASQDYLTLAKKDAVRDLSATIGFIAIGLASTLYAKKDLSEEKELLDKKQKETDSNYITYFPPIIKTSIAINTFWALFLNVILHTQYSNEHFKDVLRNTAAHKLIDLPKPIIFEPQI